MIFDLMNSVACIVLAVMTAPVAKAMHNRGFWAQRLGLWIIVITLGVMSVSPLWDGMQSASAPQAIFMAVLAAVAYRARYEIMAAVRLTMSAPDTEHPYRRAQDIERMSMSSIHGGVRDGG